MDYIFKTETDGLKSGSALCLAVIAIGTGDEFEFADDPRSGLQPIGTGIRMLGDADTLISHTSFHRNVLRDRYGLDISGNKWIDTAEAAARLWQRDGNGLDAWASRLGCRRLGVMPGAVWQRHTQDRCLNDARIIWRLFRRLVEDCQCEPLSATGNAALLRRVG